MVEHEIDEHALEVAVIRGQAIARIMGDPAMQELLAGIEREYFKAWKASTDVETRELLYAKARALSDLGIAFQAVVDSGDLATLTLKKQRDTR